ncbi:MAG: ATP-binding cassette domain-containing protein, partial [Streptococcaceae bacterium]|nr:ATP-binding cassette domain-containing protein [Streptococcaceae bacterium]
VFRYPRSSVVKKFVVLFILFLPLFLNLTIFSLIFNHEGYRRKIGYIHQDFRLIDDWTVFENITYPLLAKGENLSFIKAKILNIATQLKITDQLNHFPFEISGGEKQRAAIARAVIKGARIILADEPTGNLDPQNSYEIAKFLCSISEKNRVCVLFVTHDIELIKKIPKKAINLGEINND